MSNLNEEFQIHETLNPKLWDSAGQLLPEAKEAIIKVVKVFESELSCPINIIDVQIVGSNASFNYIDSEGYQSDVDVHIISNFELVSKQVELVNIVYQLEKSKFNDKHNITIHGVPIELYVQDVNSGIESNGIYSVLDNSWIKEPKPMNSASKKNISKEFETWKNHIFKVIGEQNKDEIMNSINTLYLIRHNSIAADGESGAGNQLFKEIRSQGLLDRLKDAYNELVDREITVESLADQGYSNGQLIQIMNYDIK